MWPLIARAIVADDQGFLVEPGETHGRLLEADPERRFVDPLIAIQEPLRAVLPSKPRIVTSENMKAVMERIRACESQGNPRAKNPSSTASGSYQFLRGSWEYYGKQYWGSLEGKDVFNHEDNEELAYYVAGRYGYSSWAASSHCWQ